MRILNLGAGNRVLVGSKDDTVINHDITAHRPEINCVWDLNVLAWPFEDNEFDKIEIISVVEHLRPNLIEVMNELWRILKKSGILVIKYPLYTAETVHDDPTHRWFLSAVSLDYVIPGTRYGEDYSFYSPYKWQLLARGVVKQRNLKAELTPIK